MKFRVVLFILLACLLSGCGFRQKAAPISWLQYVTPETHVVRSGETLSSIAEHYGVSYQSIAQLNDLKSPYVLKRGQTLYLKRVANKSVALQTVKPKTTLTKVKPDVKTSQKKSKPSVVTAKPKAKQSMPTHTYASKLSWQYPLKGRLAYRYSPTKNSKGIGIAGYYGQAVYAAAKGKVIYVGHNVSGYGNMLIIKHNAELLSVYAHNKAILVKEGMWVKKGQKIARLGVDLQKKPILHFEIRYNAKPRNPLNYLKR